MATFRLGSKRDVDMTTGNITGHIIRFAIPLLLGNLFQQLYNMVDTWVVGNYVSDDAFAAVGGVSPIVNMLIGAFMGLSSGAGVVISQYYGAGKYDKVQEAVHTSAAITLILSVVFTAVGLLITPLMLGLMDMPETAVDEASIYLNIYFGGMIGLLIYNMGSGILRAIGDSKRPFYFLVVCALLNTGLDLLFVLVFRMGVEGVALATIISQSVSATLVIITLLRAKNCVRITLSKLKIHWQILKKVLGVGIPTALQMAITAFSNVFVLSYITHFDNIKGVSYHLAGWTAYLKIDQLLLLPMQSIALSVTTFVGQNLGKGLTQRAKQGVNRALLISVVITIILTIPLVIFAPYFVSFFNKNQNVIAQGSLYLRVMTPFYFICAISQIYMFAMRGAGNSRPSLILMVSYYVVFRQIYLFIMERLCNELIPIVLSYPVTWVLCAATTAIYFYCIKLEKTRLVEDI